jgi:hypothetical protein
MKLLNIKEMKNIGMQALDVATTLEKALEDNKVDKAEIDALKKELSEVKGAWEALISKT